MTPMDQQSTALLYGFWARTSGAERKRKHWLATATRFFCCFFFCHAEFLLLTSYCDSILIWLQSGLCLLVAFYCLSAWGPVKSAVLFLCENVAVLWAWKQRKYANSPRLCKWKSHGGLVNGEKLSAGGTGSHNWKTPVTKTQKKPLCHDLNSIISWKTLVLVLRPKAMSCFVKSDVLL